MCDPVVSRTGLHAYCARQGLIIEHEIGVQTSAGRLGPLSFLVNVPFRLLALMSRGRLKATHNNLIYIIRKP